MEKKEKAIKECDFYIYFGSAKYKSDVHKFAANVLLDELEIILGKEVDVDIEKSPLEGMYHVYLSFMLDKDIIEEKVKKIEQFVKKNGGKFKKTRKLENTVCNVFELDPMKVFDFHSSGSDEDEIIEELLDSAEIECITNMLDSKGNVEVYKI